MKKALITGISGQDGSYLTEFLLARDYEIHGIVRRASSFNRDRLEKWIQDVGLYGKRLFLHYGDLTDSLSLNRLIDKIRPDEIYNLAGQSHVGLSFEMPEYTADVDAMGALRLLDAIHEERLSCRFYQASSSEMFGRPREVPQTEETPFQPRTPYAVAKLYAFWTTVNYREAYDLFACNGIMYNHESPRRSLTFVTRKISAAAARIKLGSTETLALGNLDGRRDWGFAGDYVDAMWRMLQQDTPGDYVVATGKTHSVRDFCDCAFRAIGVELAWEGSGVDETGIDRRSGRVLVRVDPKYFRPLDNIDLVGNAEKARRLLGWQPQVSFADLVETMVREDLQRGGVAE